MKKAFLLGLAVLIMLALVGMSCDIFGGDGEEPDGPWKNELMTKGLDNFEVIMGENPGDIKYKFSATEPSATYTLYYALGSIKSALGMIGSAIALGQLQEVNPSNEYQVLTLTPSASYSVVIEAKKGTTVAARSAVKWITAKEAPPQLQLTVPNQSGITIVAAALFDNLENAPVAVAVNANGTYKFFAYDENSQTLMGAAWTKTGEYYVLLSSSMDESGTQWIYTNNTQAPAKYNFVQATGNTLTFSQFTMRTQ